MRPAFTLVELLLAAAVLAIVLAAAQSVILLASKALPNANSELTQRASAAATLEMLNAMLSDATAITTATSSSIECTVPDRTGDGTPDIIRVQWSGTSGQPVTVSVNGGTPTALIQGIQTFSLGYDTAASPAPETATAGPEILLCSNDATANLRDYQVDTSHWAGQYVRPNLAASARSWSITRVKFKIRKRSSDDGRIGVQVRPALGAFPQATILNEVTLNESTFDSNYLWREITFSNAGGFGPGTAACIIVQGMTSEAGEIQYQDSGATVPNSNWIETNDGGGSFNSSAIRSMQIYVWGRVVSTDAAANQQLLRAIRCALRTASARIYSTIPVRNQPPVVVQP
jgi:prepilin-type N-terminal cleavage/methylation domain-containing protein